MLSLIKKQDWLLNLTILFLAISSLLILYSVGSDFFWRQVFWFIVVFIVILSFSLVDWRSLMSYRWLVLLIYLAVVLLLGLTLIFAPTIRSSKSWLVIGPLRFQTAEFAKVALILILFYYFSNFSFIAAGFRFRVNFFQYLVGIPIGERNTVAIYFYRPRSFYNYKSRSLAISFKRLSKRTGDCCF